MQLDRTTIAIRERGLLDTLDLSLHVLRRYAGPLAIHMALGVVPLMLATLLATAVSRMICPRPLYKALASNYLDRVRPEADTPPAVK